MINSGGGGLVGVLDVKGLGFIQEGGPNLDLQGQRSDLQLPDQQHAMRPEIMQQQQTSNPEFQPMRPDFQQQAPTQEFQTMRPELQHQASSPEFQSIRPEFQHPASKPEFQTMRPELQHQTSWRSTEHPLPNPIIQQLIRPSSRSELQTSQSDALPSRPELQSSWPDLRPRYTEQDGTVLPETPIPRPVLGAKRQDPLLQQTKKGIPSAGFDRELLERQGARMIDDIPGAAPRPAFAPEKPRERPTAFSASHPAFIIPPPASSLLATSAGMLGSSRHSTLLKTSSSSVVGSANQGLVPTILPLSPGLLSGQSFFFPSSSNIHPLYSSGNHSTMSSK